MSKETMYKRLFSRHTGIPYYRFRPGMYDSATEKTFSDAVKQMEEFRKYPFKIADNLFGMSQIRRYCERAVEQGQKENHPTVGAIAIDYIQLISWDLSKINNRVEEVSKVSRELKVLAADLDVPVVAISSLNRAGLADGQEPDTINLRESGSLEFDAEAIMFLHNPAYKPGKPYEAQPVTDMILNLARQRNGPTDRIPLKFIGSYMSFMTEEEYAVNFAHNENKNDDGIPLSKGTMFERDKAHESSWDEDDDE